MTHIRKTVLVVIVLAALLIAIGAACNRPSGIYRFTDRLPIEQVASRGFCHLQAGRSDSAIIYFSALQSRPPRQDTPRGQALAAGYLCDAADLLSKDGTDYAQAYDYLLTARELAEGAGSDSIVGEVDFRIAGINFIFMDYDKSHRLIKQCFTRAADAGEATMVMKSMSNLLTTAFVSDDYYKDIQPLLARFDTMKLASCARLRFVKQYRQALTACQEGHYEATLELLQGCQSHINARWDDGQAGYVLASIRATLLRHMGRIDEAIALVRGFGADGTPEKRHRLYQGLWRCYEAKGMKDSAQYYLTRKVELMDSVFNTGRYGSLRNMEMRIKTDRAARNYHLLQVRSNLHLAMFFIALAFTLVVAGLSWRLYRQHQRLIERNKDLYRKYQDHRESEERLMQMMSQEKPQEAKPKYATSNLGQQEMLEIVAQCRQALEQGEDVYHADFRIDTLAEAIHQPKHRVSQSINEVTGQNFGSFIAEIRVKRACTLLTEPDTARRLTIEAIAAEVGFKSRTHFVTVFKRVTALTPTEYQKAANYLTI